MAVDWDYYNKFDGISERYLPDRGEGETKATQIVTAVTKLVYKWYNDGDVFDNTHWLLGWANDLSSYANWLDKYAERSSRILHGISGCRTEDAYEDLLKDLTDMLFDDKYLEKMNNEPKIDTIYKCDGCFEFREQEEEYDEWDDEDEEDY